MRRIETHIDIDAPARAVWEHLIDFPSYAAEHWNEYLLTLDVTMERGGRVHGITESPRLPRRELRARIVSHTFPDLTWEAKLPIPGIVHAVHYFRLATLSAESTRLVQGEQVSGLLTPAFWHLVEKSEPGFVLFNEALKRRAEAAYSAA